MLSADAYNHPVSDLELIETHISWVILTGEYAYKIKKPVNFGFLDFSTLDKRRDYCEQEIMLNRRLAPELYLEVVSIKGAANNPSIYGTGKVLEYAVKMRQFSQSVQMDNMLATNELTLKHMDALALMTAEFHRHSEVAGHNVDYGDSSAIYHPVIENFKQIRDHLPTGGYDELLNELEQWSSSEFARLEPVFEQRKRDGFIRQCHGDMHLRNLIWLNNKPMAFDCIEFNPDLSWIDVISEVAFLIMDLQSRSQTRLANRFINSYLQATGDYAGLTVLPFYLSYRALVRAKVAALRVEQKDCPKDEVINVHKEFDTYLQLAKTYTRNITPQLIIMHGMSAVGKSTVSQQLIDEMGIIRIRSDVERKRLFNVAIQRDTSGSLNEGLYSEETSQLTYAKLVELAESILSAGYSVIVDATFLEHTQRVIFNKLAHRLNVPYIILQLTASFEALKKRILQRQDGASDANLAVLELQISNMKPFHENEMQYVVHVSTDDELNVAELKNEIQCRLSDPA